MSNKSMILRFRDLSTNSGETISFHRAVIDDKKYVWWGWWRKAGETIPSETFQAIMATIDKQGALDVLLFDTGTGTLYPAKIAEIHWDPRFSEIESPDWDTTPEYYEGRKLKAWFKLTEIGEGNTSEDELNHWSYVEVGELFETKKSVFQVFDGKQVSTFEELRHQERTIWFVRPYKPGDDEHKILLHESASDKPSNFPESIIESHSARLLWLSDLHFSSDHHAFPLHDGVQKGNNLSEAIRKDLDKQGIQEVGGIIITGDLTWRAEKKEFALVRSFLNDIMSWSTLKPNQIIFCPGNHDIAFSDKPWEKGSLITEATDISKKNFEEAYTDLFSVAPNPFLASGRRFLLARSSVVEIASLNSSVFRQTENVFQGQGFVGEEQRSFVASEMRWPNQSAVVARPFRIVMLHHHVVPVIPNELAIYEQQSSLVYDAGALCNWIVEHRIDLVLHGHMHHTKVVKEARSLGLVKGNTDWHNFTIASLGSTGVDLNHNLLDRKNVYGLLSFSDKGVQLLIRELHPKDSDQPVDPTIVDIEIINEKNNQTI